MPAVIFVTAYDVHALRAFEVHALDYILKPFDDARFRTVLAHARERLSADEARQMAGRLAALLADRRFAALPDAAVERRSTEGTATRFTVRRDDRIRFVKAQDVDWIEAAGNYIRLHVGDEVHQLRATLASTLEHLDPRTFVRIHRSAIVNVERIREVQPWFGGDYVAILRNGRQLRVSRHYRDDLLRPSA
jgi:two-component system LytT family response regulator